MFFGEAAVGYVWEGTELWRGRLSFRIEYTPYFDSRCDTEASTKYDRQTFVIALKADGIRFYQESTYLNIWSFKVGIQRSARDRGLSRKASGPIADATDLT